MVSIWHYPVVHPLHRDNIRSGIIAAARLRGLSARTQAGAGGGRQGDSYVERLGQLVSSESQQSITARVAVAGGGSAERAGICGRGGVVLVLVRRATRIEGGQNGQDKNQHRYNK